MKSDRLAGLLTGLLFGIPYLSLILWGIFGARPQATQTELWCYSGGHLILYDVCDETYTGNGYTQCVNSDGDTLIVSGDCVEHPVGYE